MSEPYYFQTSDESKAFDKLLSKLDNSLDTYTPYEVKKLVWFAAREFFSKPTGDDEKTQVTEATISYSDLHLREQALSLASLHSDGLNAASIVAKAEAFLSFLQTGKSEGAQP